MTTPRRPGRRPDPRSMRWLHGVGAIAAVSVLAVTMVRPAADPASAAETLIGDRDTSVGETAGPALIVIGGDVGTAARPTTASGEPPRIRTAPQSQQRRVRARTRQSGA